MATDPAKFLDVVWSKQPTSATFAFASHKDWGSGDWSEYPITLPFQSVKLPAIDHDLYFAPNLFNHPRRLRRYATGGRWLYADLDEVNPSTLESFLTPTIAWETSPGRFQAMWLLDRSLSPRTLERLNQQLTYYTGADKGGWSLTKVLRVPGTLSTKHEHPFRVHLCPRPLHRRAHRYEELSAFLRDVDVDTAHPGTADRPLLRDLPDRDDVWRKRRRRIPVRGRTLLRSDSAVVSDDRSARLWELETILLDAGLPPEEVLVLVRDSAWNKFAGQRRELDMLWRDIQRATANRADPNAQRDRQRSAQRRTADDSAGPVPPRRRRSRAAPFATSYRDLMSRPTKRTSWLVDGIWSDEAHGMMAGEAKSYKTLLCLDLAVSVASGTPFLGKFPVPSIGPVLIVQEENQEGDIRDRLMRITASRNIGPALRKKLTIDFGADLPIAVRNNTGFSFINEDDMKELEKYIRANRPKLIIFDPLYLLTPGLNENLSADMTPILNDLLRLKQKYGCGIMIVHHYRKPATDGQPRSTRSADRVSGTGVFHRWIASAVYVERPDETLPLVRVSSEHRSHASPGAFAVRFDLGTDDDLHYAATVEPWSGVQSERSVSRPTTDDELIEAILASAKPLIRVADLASALGITRTALRSRLRRRQITVHTTKTGTPVIKKNDVAS